MKTTKIRVAGDPSANQGEHFRESGNSPPGLDAGLMGEASDRFRVCSTRLEIVEGAENRTTSIGTLALRWRAEAERFRSLEANGQAAAFEQAARELELAMARQANEVLTIREASNESGYSEDHLGRLLREGTIPNAGEPFSPRIRRCDLPRKPGYCLGDVGTDCEPVDSREQIARAVVNSDTGGHDG